MVFFSPVSFCLGNYIRAIHCICLPLHHSTHKYCISTEISKLGTDWSSKLNKFDITTQNLSVQPILENIRGLDLSSIF
uniref:Uncharacterized protein n=1 Tax=Arundo donax TaxID=35708 RepID=A0A0A9EZ43_ARUDO